MLCLFRFPHVEILSARASRILRTVLCSSGFTMVDSAWPGDVTALWEAGIIFCIATSKVIAEILIEEIQLQFLTSGIDLWVASALGT